MSGTWPRRKPGENWWTPDEVAQLHEYAAAGLTQREAADRLGRSVRGIRYKANKERISFAKQQVRPWSNADISQLWRLSQTHTIAETASILQRTERSVIWKAGQLGVSFRKHGEAHHSTKYPTEIIRQIMELRAQGLGQRRIARIVGMGNKQVYLVLTYGSRWREAMQIDMELEAATNVSDA